MTSMKNDRRRETLTVVLLLSERGVASVRSKEKTVGNKADKDKPVRKEK